LRKALGAEKYDQLRLLLGDLDVALFGADDVD